MEFVFFLKQYNIGILSKSTESGEFISNVFSTSSFFRQVSKIDK